MTWPRIWRDPEFRRQHVQELVIATSTSSSTRWTRPGNVQGGVGQRRAGGGAQAVLGTLAEIAAVRGMRVTFEPLPPAERNRVTVSLLEGRAADTRALAEHLAECASGGESGSRWPDQAGSARSTGDSGTGLHHGGRGTVTGVIGLGELGPERLVEAGDDAQ